MRRRGIVAVAGTLVVAGLLAGCAGTEPESAPPPIGTDAAAEVLAESEGEPQPITAELAGVSCLELLNPRIADLHAEGLLIDPIPLEKHFFYSELELLDQPEAQLCFTNATGDFHYSGPIYGFGPVDGSAGADELIGRLQRDYGFEITSAADGVLLGHTVLEAEGPISGEYPSEVLVRDHYWVFSDLPELVGHIDEALADLQIG